MQSSVFAPGAEEEKAETARLVCCNNIYTVLICAVVVRRRHRHWRFGQEYAGTKRNGEFPLVSAKLNTWHRTKFYNPTATQRMFKLPMMVQLFWSRLELTTLLRKYLLVRNRLCNNLIFFQISQRFKTMKLVMEPRVSLFWQVSCWRKQRNWSALESILKQSLPGGERRLIVHEQLWLQLLGTMGNNWVFVHLHSILRLVFFGGFFLCVFRSSEFDFQKRPCQIPWGSFEHCSNNNQLENSDCGQGALCRTCRDGCLASQGWWLLLPCILTSPEKWQPWGHSNY